MLGLRAFRRALPLRREIATIARLAAPLAIAQFGLTAIGLVDVAVLGHASAADLGGASIGRSINFASRGASGIGVAAALEPLAAQAVGAGEHDVAWRALHAARIADASSSGFPCRAARRRGHVAPRAASGSSASLVGPARAFLVPQLPGMLAFSVFLAAKSFLQAHERTTRRSSRPCVANVVNLVVVQRPRAR